jgi:hypothetical protein
LLKRLRCHEADSAEGARGRRELRTVAPRLEEPLHPGRRAREKIKKHDGGGAQKLDCSEGKIPLGGADRFAAREG